MPLTTTEKPQCTPRPTGTGRLRSSLLAARGARIDVWNRPNSPRVHSAGHSSRTTEGPRSFRPQPRAEAAIREAMIAAGVTPPDESHRLPPQAAPNLASRPTTTGRSGRNRCGDGSAYHQAIGPATDISVSSAKSSPLADIRRHRQGIEVHHHVLVALLSHPRVVPQIVELARGQLSRSNSSAKAVAVVDDLLEPFAANHRAEALDPCQRPVVLGPHEFPDGCPPAAVPSRIGRQRLAVHRSRHGQACQVEQRGSQVRQLDQGPAAQSPRSNRPGQETTSGTCTRLS